MKRRCPHCQIELKDNCYINDHGINGLSYLELITKDHDLKKEHYELRSSYCPHCGYVELWVDFEQYNKLPTSEVQSKEELDEVVNKFANDHRRRLALIQEKKEKEEKIKRIKDKAKENRQKALQVQRIKKKKIKKKV